MNLLPIIRYVVQGESMTPRFLPSQRVFVNRLSYFFHKPKRGDVVIVKDPRKTDRELLKRITALPGDVIENIVLKDNEYFIVGDNPEASTDSRALGPIKKSLIVGKVTLTL